MHDFGRDVREIKTGKVYTILDTFVVGMKGRGPSDYEGGYQEYMEDLIKCASEAGRGVFVNSPAGKLYPDEYEMLGPDPEAPPRVLANLAAEIRRLQGEFDKRVGELRDWADSRPRPLSEADFEYITAKDLYNKKLDTQRLRLTCELLEKLANGEED